MYGVVQSGDHVGRTCVVKWFKLKPSGDDVEVRSKAPASSLPHPIRMFQCFWLLLGSVLTNF